MVLLWGIAAYGVMADPLNGETARFRWRRWQWVLAFRVILAFGIAYSLSRSIALSGLLLLATLLQPFLRYRFRMRWLAEFETFCIFAVFVLSWIIIRQFHLSSQWVPLSIFPAQMAALCVLAGTLLVVVRGGTYVVRGILKKAGTLISPERVRSRPKPADDSPSQPQAEVSTPVSIAAAAEELAPMTVDIEEYNRGRLIGNLERIVLTIVVAAGSYAALAFLVAAKGVVRSDEFERSRDFTEYFLIGSLASVLVALCAGIVLRFALIRLWPDLLTLQMQ
jgi:hypothetical protein